jgi:hypothetical protein
MVGMPGCRGNEAVSSGIGCSFLRRSNRPHQGIEDFVRPRQEWPVRLHRVACFFLGRFGSMSGGFMALNDFFFLVSFFRTYFHHMIALETGIARRRAAATHLT